MPLIKNPALPNYLISCSSKRVRQRLLSFDSIGSNPSSNPGSGPSSSSSTRCSSRSETEPKPTVSKFRSLCSQGLFPFVVDYSVEPHPLTNKVQVAWKVSIQTINIDWLLPLLLEGYEDSLTKYHRIVDAALSDLLRHASLAQLYLMGSIMRQPMKRLFMSKNKETVLSGLNALQQILRVIQRSAPIAPNHLRSLLVPINNYYVQWRNTFDMEALYQKRRDLLDVVDKAISIIESHSPDTKKRWRCVKAVNGVYKGYASRILPGKSAVINLGKTSSRQKSIQKCVLFRPHHDPNGWRQLHRYSIAPDCRGILKLMPWVVPKASNFYCQADDVRVIDMNLN